MTAETHGEGQLRQIIRHQGYVGGLQGDVRSRRTHGDADRRGGHRRSIVDAIADHGDLGLRPEFLDGVDLVLRHQVAPRLGQPDLTGHRLGRLLVVARDHDHAANAERAERGKGLARLGPRRVEKADDPEILCPAANHHERPSLVSKARDGDLGVRCERSDGVRTEHLRRPGVP